MQPGIKVSWPAGSPQEAFLTNGISGSGKLRYYHQVLLYVPGGSKGEPRALGQYGGVVGADAQEPLAPVAGSGPGVGLVVPGRPLRRSRSRAASPAAVEVTRRGPRESVVENRNTGFDLGDPQ